VRQISARIATAVADVAYQQHHASEPRPADLLAAVTGAMYEPTYAEYV
jgi:malate dehydrogenase (oxaloacetate-decarboxylating)(NADP+)